MGGLRRSEAGRGARAARRSSRGQRSTAAVAVELDVAEPRGPLTDGRLGPAEPIREIAQTTARPPAPGSSPRRLSDRVRRRTPRPLALSRANSLSASFIAARSASRTLVTFEIPAARSPSPRPRRSPCRRRPLGRSSADAFRRPTPGRRGCTSCGRRVFRILLHLDHPDSVWHFGRPFRTVAGMRWSRRGGRRSTRTT